MAKIFFPPQGARSGTAWDVPKALLDELNALEDAVVLVNFNTGGGAKDDRQVDLAILTPRAVHVVEIKNYRHPVFASPNGHWYVLYPNGRRKPIVNQRGRMAESPVVQARRNARAVRKAIQRYTKWKAIKVYAYVLLPSLAADSQVETRVPEGVRICTSIDDFLQSFGYNESRSQVYVAPHLLPLFPLAIGLEEIPWQARGQKIQAYLAQDQGPSISKSGKASPSQPTGGRPLAWRSIFGNAVLWLAGLGLPFVLAALADKWIKHLAHGEAVAVLVVGLFVASIVGSGPLYLLAPTRRARRVSILSFFYGVMTFVGMLLAWVFTELLGRDFLLVMGAMLLLWLIVGWRIGTGRLALYGWAIGSLLWLLTQ